MWKILLRKLLMIPFSLTWMAFGWLAIFSAMPVVSTDNIPTSTQYFTQLPAFFNRVPFDRPHIISSLVLKLPYLEEKNRNKAIQQILQIGAAGLGDIVAALDRLSPQDRRRVARELSPLAKRMELDTSFELDDLTKIDLFWAHTFDEFGPDFRSAVVRRTLRRFLLNPEDELYLKQIHRADTAIFRPLFDMLKDPLELPHRALLESIAIQMAARVGAAQVSNITSLQLWWAEHQAMYIEFDQTQRLIAHATQTRLGRWLALFMTQRFNVIDRNQNIAIEYFMKNSFFSVQCVCIALGILFIFGIFSSYLQTACSSTLHRGSIVLMILGCIGAAIISTNKAHFYSRFQCISWLILLSIMPFLHSFQNYTQSLLHEDFIRTARAKGAHRFRLWFRHVIRIAIGPMITTSTVQVPTLFILSCLLEEWFYHQGLGHYILESIRYVDVPPLLFFTITLILLMMVLSVLSDFVCALLDIRIYTSMFRSKFVRR